MICKSLSGNKKKRSASSSNTTSSASGSKRTSKSADRKLQHYRRIISLELAKWIKKNPNCSGSDFKEFYQNDLTEALGIKKRNREFTMVSAEKKFRTYLSNTVLKVIKEALRGIKKPRTITEIVAVSPEAKIFRTLHSTFDRVLALRTTCNELMERNVAFCDVLRPDVSDVPLEYKRVTIMCGPSGSGKTITSLAVATRSKDVTTRSRDVVFYIQLTESSLTNLGENASRDDRNNAVRKFVVKTIDKILHDYTLKRASELEFNVVIVIDEVGAHSQFLAGLCSCLPQLSAELHNKFFESQVFLEDSAAFNTPTRIRFIAAGTGASYVTAQAASKRERYTTYFIGSKGTDNYFDVLLKGLCFKLEELARDCIEKNKDIPNEQKTMKFLLPEEIADMREKLLRLSGAVQQKTVDGNIKVMNEYIQEEEEKRNGKPMDRQLEQQQLQPWITPTEKAAADLVKNARCAALLLQKAFTDGFNYNRTTLAEQDALREILNGVFNGSRIPWWQSLPTFHKKLQSWIPQVLDAYISMNGLQEATDPTNIIKYAVAASLFRLPCLPDGFERHSTTATSPTTPDPNAAATGPAAASPPATDSTITPGATTTPDANATTSPPAPRSSTPSAPAYTATLITRGGVLVDLADSFSSSLDPKSHILLDGFVEPPSSDDNSEDEKCALKVADATTRFFTSPAHVVMLRTACGLPIDRSPEFSYSLEYDLADFCALTLICASAYRQMRRDIAAVAGADGLAKLDEFDKKYNYKYDSLFSLKKKLAHEYCGIDDHGIRGAKILHLVDSPLRSIQKYASMTRKRDEKKDTEKETERKKQEEDLKTETERKKQEENLENVARAKTNLLCADLEASLERGEAVVIISREMESFADVIVVSPGRVMLIQCKQKPQPKKSYNYTYIYWMDEIEKMCGFEEKADDFTEVGRKDKMRRIYLDGLKKAAAVNGQPVDVELVFLVEGEEETCNWCRDDLQSRTNNIKRDEHSAMIKQGSIIKKWKNTIISEGIDVMPWKSEKDNEKTTLFPVSFFAVHRLSRADSRWRSYPPPFFPIPHHSEGLHADSGINFVTGEYVAPKKSLELAKFVEKKK